MSLAEGTADGARPGYDTSTRNSRPFLLHRRHLRLKRLPRIVVRLGGICTPHLTTRIISTFDVGSRAGKIALVNHVMKILLILRLCIISFGEHNIIILNSRITGRPLQSIALCARTGRWRSLATILKTV